MEKNVAKWCSTEICQTADAAFAKNVLAVWSDMVYTVKNKECPLVINLLVRFQYKAGNSETSTWTGNIVS
jgi:hypothetical protein